VTFQFKGLQDSFRSLLTGLGIPGRDKSISLSPYRDNISYDMRELESLYRSNWLANKIVSIPAFDTTRSWRSWDAEQDQVQKLEKAEKEFGLQRKLMDAMIKSRLYGGSAMIMGIKGSRFNEELKIDQVGKGDLAFVHVVEKWMIQAGPRVRDITSPWFGEPSYYMRSNTPIIQAPGNVTPIKSSSLGYEPGETIFIHPSRVVRLVGQEYPDMEMAPDAWGDSVLSTIYEAIRDAGLVTQSLANMISDCKVDVYKIPGLTSTLSTQAGTDKMINYLANANVAKSVINSLVIDKEIDWERIQTKFEGLPEVLQAYLLICSAAADIPSTRMLSREPSGQNATGESDIRNYYDRLSSEQNVILTPVLSRLDEVLIRHALGDRPDSVTYEWNPLWQMTAAEKADIAFKKAQAYQIDVNTALIPAEALVIGRQNQLIEDGVYPGLETAIDDLEDKWNEEAEYLPVQQMNQFAANQNANPDSDDDDDNGPPKPKPKVQPDKKNDRARRLAHIDRRLYGDSIPVIDSHYRIVPVDDKGTVRFEPVNDEGGQSALGFMTSQATSPERGRKRRRKRPFDYNHENDPILYPHLGDEWSEEKHPRGQPSNSGEFASGGGGVSESNIADRKAQSDSIAGLVDYLRSVGHMQNSADGRLSKESFVLQNGTPYMANAKTYSEERGPQNLCYMNASKAALDIPGRTYVEGFVTVHGVPIQHAWTVDQKGQIYDNTINPNKHVSGYFGVPFTKDYLRNAMLNNGYYGLLGRESKKTIGPLLRGEAKNFKQAPDPSKLSDDVTTERLLLADRILSAIPVTDSINSPDRTKLRDNVVDALYNRNMNNRTRNRQATIVLGLPGSGKSNISEPLVKAGRLEIEGDNAKAMLPEFFGGVGAYAVHEESSSIMRRVLAKAIKAGDDIVWPRIDSKDKIVNDVKSLHDAGYEVSVKFVDVPTSVAIHSAINRFLKMGRYVSPEMIVNYGSAPRESYEAAINTGLLKSHERYERGPGKSFIQSN
jgi:phage-related protein (TIGR01555 family)